jgi:hypothetical protein
MNRTIFIAAILLASSGIIAQVFAVAMAPATCKGEHPCKACKNCSQCKYCHKDGGYCGVCDKPVEPDSR